MHKMNNPIPRTSSTQEPLTDKNGDDISSHGWDRSSEFIVQSCFKQINTYIMYISKTVHHYIGKSSHFCILAEKIVFKNLF